MAEEEEVSSGKKKAPVVVYPSWSEGARRLDAALQRSQETPNEARLASIVAGIGEYATGENAWSERPELFVKGPSCLEKLKDLQRCISRDNPETRRVFLQIGSWNVAGKHLVPLIIRYPEESHIFLTTLKISVLLTVPVSPSSENTFDQVEYLCQIKEHFRNRRVMGTIVAHLVQPLEHMESGCVTEEDWRILQLVVTLFEQLLAVPERMKWVGPYPNERYSRLRDGILECMFQESATDVVLAIIRNLPTCQRSLRQDNFIVLRILHHIFWGQSPELLLRSATLEGKLQTEAETEKAEENERKERIRKMKQFFPRHTHFSGTFVRIEQDGTKTMIARNPFQTTEEVLAKRCETSGRKDKPVARDVEMPLPSEGDVGGQINELAEQVLSTGAYNGLMETVKDDILRDRRGIGNADVAIFFQTVQFFTSYLQRKYLESQGDDMSVSVSYASSTFDETMFLMLLSKWHTFLDSVKATGDWIPVVATGSLLKELIYMLDVMVKKGGQRDVRIARTLLFKLFYDQSEEGIIPTTRRLVKAFNIHKQPRSHLVNMVGVAHIVLRLMENLVKEEGALRIAKKARRRKSKQKQTDGQKHGSDNEAPVIHNVESVNKGEEEAPESGKEVDRRSSSEDEMDAREGALDVRRCITTFSGDIAIISKYCWLLTFYDSNSPALNYYILCMLRRVCKDAELEPLLYQVSILENFHTILADKKIATMAEYKDLVSFVTKLVRNFFKKLKTNPLLYVEALFAKSKNEALELSADYIKHKLKAYKTDPVANRKGILDALGEDEAGSRVPMSSAALSGQVTVPGMALRTKLKSKRGRFTEEEESRMRELFEQYKQKRSCFRLIAEALGNFSAGQVKRRLKQLGFQREPPKNQSSSQEPEANGRTNDRATDGSSTDDEGEQDRSHESASERSDDEATDRFGDQDQATGVSPANIESGKVAAELEAAFMEHRGEELVKQTEDDEAAMQEVRSLKNRRRLVKHIPSTDAEKFHDEEEEADSEPSEEQVPRLKRPRMVITDDD